MWSGLERALLVTTVAGFALAAVFGVFLAGSFVPPGAAAKVGDFFVDDSEVAEYIAEQRFRNGVEDDSAFATYLLQQGMNVYTYRQSIINQIALDRLIENRASDLGAMPSEADVEGQVKALWESNGIEDEDAWQEYLDERGVSDSGLRSQIRTNLAEDAMYERDVQRKEASDEELIAYIKSNRAGGTEKHSWRMIFSGEGAKERAETALAKVRALGDKLSPKTFSALATKLSDSPTVSDDGGDAGWTYMDGSSSYASALSALKEGGVSEVLQTETDGNYGIAYCDNVYSYPEAAAVEELKVSELPEGLADDLRGLAEEEAWKTDCGVYLTALLADADITYYPIPKGAVYDIDMKLAAMASGEALGDEG